MYPESELIRLAAHKAVLRRRIAVRRAECAAAAACLIRPFEWLDRMLGYWRRLSPFVKFAAVPLGFLLKRSAAPRLRVLSTLLRWGPLVIGAVRGLAASRPRPTRV